MNPIFRPCALIFCFGLVASLGPAQRGVASQASQAPQADRSDDGLRLPNGKLQRDEILKAEYEENLRDSRRLVDLAEQLETDIEKNDRFVVSLSTIKKTDDIEKLVRKIRSRMRRN